MNRFSICNVSGPRLFLLIPLLFAAFLSTACVEEEGVKITGFDLQGVESIDEARLRAVLATAKSSWLPWGQKRYFDRARFEADLKRIVAFYADRGFPDARVVKYDAAFNDDKTSVKLTVFIEEGEPVVVEEIRFAGFEVLPEDHLGDLKGRLSQKEGQPRDIELLTLSRSTALDEVRDHGFPHASIDMTEGQGSTERARVITLTAKPGRQARYGTITVARRQPQGEAETQEKKVSDRVILRQLTFSPGDMYRLGQVQESTRRLYALELFQFVTIEEVDPDPASDVINMRVTVVEGDSQRWRGTVGYGSEEHARVTANYRHVNFLGGARTAGFEGKWSSLDRGIGLNFGEPNLFYKTALNVRAENWYFDQPTYELTSRGARATLIRRFGQSGPLSRDRSVTTVSAGYLHEYEDYTVFPEALGDPTFRPTLIALGLDPETGRAQGWLSAVTFDVNRNTTENLLDARRGYVLTAHVEQAGLGGDYKYLELTGEGRHYLNINDRAVFATRIRGATLAGTDNPNVDIPFFKRYFLGGSQSLRGWGRFEVAPLDENGLPVGGFTSFEGTVEIRMPVTTNIGGVLFADAGNVWPDRYDFNLNDMKYDVGFGIRYRTPVGPLRFDFGYQLTKIERLVIEGRTADQQRRWRLHFSVGQAF